EVASDICYFFQAEDGIRDRNVTGVQTCALPIYTFFRSYADQILLDPMTGYIALLVMGVGLTASTAVVLVYKLLRNAKSPLETTRSEERRVGKECRYERGP